MPRRVDRDARRLEIVDTYLTIAARDGMETATSRTLAAELGVASGALWHYFTGFDEVLHEALRRIFERTSVRITEHTEGLQGMRALTAMLREILPLDEETRNEAYVVVSFWGRVPSRPGMASIQSDIVQQWHDDFYTLLSQAQSAGELNDDAPLHDLSDALLALCTGFQVEYVLRTPLAEKSRQWRLVIHTLRPWITSHGLNVAGAGQLPDEPARPPR